jgi:hypothetical protein
MHIANPIYDVVFKYLMEDNKIARMLISAIIEEEVEELEFRPQESSITLMDKPFTLVDKPITVYRLDFSARLKLKDGSHKQVIIEIQKAKYPADIMRFRKYLGEQYRSEKNTYRIGDDEATYKALPLVTIYFLGYGIEHTDAPVIHVNRICRDGATGDIIKVKNEFIESLTHDCHIIQIPYLKERRRNEVELLLSVFDQNNQTNNSHILDIQEEDFPEKYHAVIRRLQRAVVEPKIQKVMDLEDEILESLQSYERTIEYKNKTIELKDKVIEQNEKAMVQKDNLIEEQARLIQELQNKLKNQQS